MILEIDELESEMYLACNKQTNPVIIESLAVAMQALSETGRLAEIERAWFATAPVKSYR